MQIYTGNCIVIVVPRGYNYLRNNESSLEPSAPHCGNSSPDFRGRNAEGAALGLA